MRCGRSWGGSDTERRRTSNAEVRMLVVRAFELRRSAFAFQEPFMADESDLIRQRRGRTSRSSCASASIRTRVRSSGRPPIHDLVRAHGGRTGEELEQARRPRADRRAHPGDPQLRQGQLPGHLGRSGANPGLHSSGLTARARLQDLPAARLRRFRRRRRAICSAPRRTSSPFVRRACSSWPSASSRCQRSGTA